MFKSKNFIVATAIMLCAVGAMANNFRGADQVYVGAAGHLTASTTFISDVWVANLSTDPVTVSVIFIPTGFSPSQAPQYINNVFDLAAGERREFVDFMVAARPNGLGLSVTSNPFGALVFNACRQGQDCIATQDADGVSIHYRDIAVSSRIYSIPNGTPIATAATTGQFFAGLPWYHYASSRAPSGLTRITIQGIRNTGGGGQAGTYRGNIGLLNASQYSTTTLTVKLFNGATRQQIGSDFNVTLSPLNHTQQNVGGMFPSFAAGPTSTNAYVTIEQSGNQATSDAPTSCLPDGCPGFLAYASVLDNVSGDATTLEAIYEQALSAQAITAIYGSSAGKPNFRRAVRRRQ